MLADIEILLSGHNPAMIAKRIAERMRMRRLELNLTQQGLAKKSGVSLGTIKRFENLYEISLKHLLMLAVILDSTEEFGALFSNRKYQSIDQVLKQEKSKQRQRGRQND